MSDRPRSYIAIDLKSFYASVECVERGLDPLTTNLVVADGSRTEKTICLAVSPSLKAHKISGRARLFEVVQRVKEVNKERAAKAPGRQLKGSSVFAPELEADPSLALDYITAPPRMAYYMEYSTRIYEVYLKYLAPEDIIVYSIDEIFADVTSYLEIYKMTAHELAMTMIRDVLKHTGVTATAGVGTNLYLAKIAMDIVAKHMPPDQDGVRIAELDERSYREQLWTHQPLTDFWRVGRGYYKKLTSAGLYTMGDIARCSLGTKRDFHNPDLLYKLFGINAELLIAHAWGWEPCTIADVKSYRPQTNCLSSGQVLTEPYEADKARLVVWEMADMMALDLVEKGLVTDQLVLTIGYDILNLTDPDRRRRYRGPVVTDGYGRQTPKHSHGTINLESYSSSNKVIMDAMMELYDRIINPTLLIRRVTLGANHVILERDIPQDTGFEQLDFFTDYAAKEKEKRQAEAQRAKERKMQEAVIELKHRFGKNAVLRGANLQEGATAKNRNSQIGGHKA
ncbi:MAG: DNA methylase [Lachnospiraceae bacterium]|nr:DNA methylase [Candidatus Equihabitans merdae]